MALWNLHETKIEKAHVVQSWLIESEAAVLSFPSDVGRPWELGELKRCDVPEGCVLAETGSGEAGGRAVREGTRRAVAIGGFGGRVVVCVSRSTVRPGK